ncbi:MAG: glutathione S-transferase family protein [Deltaproteobacteria bacterium]
MATVYGVSASPFVRKLRVFLDEKGIDYETKPVFPGTDDESFRAISPLGKVPAYRDEEVAISDSSVICAYLEKKHSEPPLYPTAGADYARALWFEEYADTAVVEPAAAVFQERVLAKTFFGRDSNEERLAKAINESLPVVCDYLEAQIGQIDPSGDGLFLVGGRLSIADIAVASPFVNLNHGGERVDASRWPGLSAYLEGILGRDSFKALIAEDSQLLGG